MDNTGSELGRFLLLFRGRGDVYGSNTGSCIKHELTADVFLSHLDGSGDPIGVYPMVPFNNDWYTVWGCSDIDIDDYGMALELHNALAAGGVHSYIERSRSKGYHVWVFASKPVLARNMRRMMLAAHQVADIPAREVNPKQETLSSSMQYGNYVRLPYPNGLVRTPDRQVILDSERNPVPLSVFLNTVQTVEPELIERLAGFYKPPVATVQIRTDYEQCESLPDAMKKLSPLGKVIWRDGPLPNGDRSRALTKLGWECVRSGLNPSEARVVIIDADFRWGKYHSRTNGELEIDKIINRVYST